MHKNVALSIEIVWLSHFIPVPVQHVQHCEATRPAIRWKNTYQNVVIASQHPSPSPKEVPLLLIPWATVAYTYDRHSLLHWL